MEPRETEMVTKRYEFTDEEKNDMGRDLAAREMDKDRIEDEKKVASDKFKNALGEVEAIIGRLSSHIHHGFEMRTCTCRIEQDWDSKMIIYRDVNTEAIVDQRPMKGNELQRDIGY